MNKMMSILACSEVLGTCCSDYGLVMLFNIVRRVFDLMQILIPIALIAMTAVRLIKIVGHSDEKVEKKQKTQIINSLIAAVIIFFLPVIVDTAMAILPTSESFQVASCWQTAKTYAEQMGASDSTYIEKEDEDERKSILIDPEDYEEGSTQNNNNNNTSSTGSTKPNNPTGANYNPNQANGSALGKQIAAYAMQFVGGAYVLEGQWDGEIPYTPTCCAGFVSGVYRHFGFKIYSTWNGYYVPNIWSATDKYTIVTDGSIKAGDLVIYNNNSHVAMLTGVGNQIVHASSPSRGVVVDSEYNHSNVKAIIRINGVN